jgi:hypothetical protein
MSWEGVPSRGPRDKRLAARMPGFLAGEGVLPVADFPTGCRAQHLDDIKAHRHLLRFWRAASRIASVVVLEKGVPLACRFDNSALLRPIHSVRRGSVFLAGACFDLYEDQFWRVPCATYQIDFTAVGGAVVLAEDFVARFPQELRRPAFAFPPELGGGRVRSPILCLRSRARGQPPVDGTKAAETSDAPAQN